MFKIKRVDKIGAVEVLSRVNTVMTRGHNLRVKNMRVRTVLRQGPFSQRVVNAWNGLPRNVVAV